jgi:teichuronic acid biosynthesis protein TuaE
VETKGLGLGGGNSRWYLLSNWSEETKPISDPHNWWLEVLCEGGLIYTLAYSAIWLWLWKLLVVRWRRARERWIGMLSLALAVALIGAVPAGISPSSMVYFMPLYTLFALAVLVAFPSAIQDEGGEHDHMSFK